MINIYGIPNCDTIKKAQTWLQQQGIAYHFHDYRKQPLSQSQLKAWAKTVPAEALLNKRSTTWKALSAAEQEAAATPAGAIKAMAQHPTLIKRPVLEINGKAVTAGFDEATWLALLKPAEIR